MATRVQQPTRSQAAAWEIGAFLRHIDYLLLLATGGLVAYGLWVLESVTRNDIAGDPDYYVFRQVIYVVVGAILLAIAAAVDPDVYRRVRWPLYAVSIGLLVSVFVLASEVRGSKRWIEIGFFNFQPSELGKLVLIVVLAGWVAERRHRVSEWGTTLGVLGISLPMMILVFKEPDFGTTLIYAAILLGALFFGGTPWRHLAVLAIVAGLAAAALLWFLPSAGLDVLEPYQRERLIGFVDPDIDPSGSTYNVNQSITAVGAGGLRRARRGQRHADEVQLPPGALDRLHLLVARRAARLPRGFDPACCSTRSSSGAGRRSSRSRKTCSRRSWRGRSCSRS